MNLQQQQQDPHTQELEEWEVDESEIKQKSINASYIIVVIAVIGIIILTVTFIAYRIAIMLQDLPKIHLQPLQQALVQTIDRKNTGKMLQMKLIPEFSTILRQVSIREFSPSILVQVQQYNSAHRGYQYAIRKAEFQNAKLTLQQLKYRQFSENSRMTYKNYLQALKAFRINTFPIRDSSQQLKILERQTKQYFVQKYKLGRRLSENNLCVLVELTKQGLQNGKYYYTLKSIFQQNYKNYKAIVINYPEMRQLNQVQNLLSTFKMKQKIVLLDKIQTSSKLQSSIFIYNSIQEHCKNSAMTLILRDTGELIGKQVFSIIDQTIHSHDPDLIITNYLLQSANPLRQKVTDTRYRVSLTNINLNKPRQMPYKTKYLKVMKTDTLLALGKKPFRNVNGGWINGLFEANLQFTMIQYSCGNVIQIEELLYKSSQKTEIESAFQLLDARKQQPQICRNQYKFIKEDKTKQNKVNKTTSGKNNSNQTTKEKKQGKNILQKEQNNTLSQNDGKIQANTSILSNNHTNHNNTVKNINASLPKYVPPAIQKPSLELVNQILEQNPNSLFSRSIENLNEKQIEELDLRFKKQSISRKMLYNTVEEKYSQSNDSSISDDSGISYKSLYQAINKLKIYTKNIIDTWIIPNIKNNNDNQLQKSKQSQQPQQQQLISNKLSNQIEFCLILTMENNDNNLSHLYSVESIIMQDYSQFRLFIIDNNSSDLTAKSMKYHLSKISEENKKKIKLYKSKQKKSRAEILQNSIKQFCSAKQVVISLKSGQLLINKDALSKLNEQYNKKNALSIYSNGFSITNESAFIGPSIYPNYKIINDKFLDKKPLFAYSLLSYRASIFYNLKLNDFKDQNGKWITEGEDQIISFGIQQLSCNSIYYLNEILIFLPLNIQQKIYQTNKNKYACFQNVGKLQKNP